MSSTYNISDFLTAEDCDRWTHMRKHKNFTITPMDIDVIRYKLCSNDTSLNTSTNSTSVFSAPSSSLTAISLLSTLFCVITVIGIIGNVIVIYSIVSDAKMRRSVTNLFILNLAVADLAIMLFGIPEIAQFILDRGWLLGLMTCKIDRYILVISLYCSITTLMAVCIERYIAIVHPIQAHIWCSRRRTLVVLAIIWPVAMLCGLPTLLFNKVQKPYPNAPFNVCMLRFPGANVPYMMAFKLCEFFFFFLLPIVVQIVMYSIIAKNLFLNTETLHHKNNIPAAKKQKDSEAIRVRKGVVKMLIATVIVYVISYTPIQIPLFYNMISPKPFKMNWEFIVLVTTLGYINSASNPILYSIFSQKFRRKFIQVFYRCMGKKQHANDPANSKGPYINMESYHWRKSYKTSPSSFGRYTNAQMTETLSS